jgi:hypothetical protein
MGYNVADFVTGRNLTSGAPVVGFIVMANPRGDDPNNSAARAGDFFMPESFPIFGKTEEGGLMHVDDESSFAVRLALRMTGMPDWEELSENAFEQRRGVQFLARADTDGAPSYHRAYGLALMHRETYDHLVHGERSALATACSSEGYRGEHRVRSDKGPDIEKVTAILDACIKKMVENGPMHAGRSDMADHVQQTGDLIRLCSLSSEWDVQKRVFPGESNLPRLLEALGTSDGRLIGVDLHATLRDAGLVGPPLLYCGQSSVSAVPDFDELLGLLWDCWHLRTRLYDVHAEFKPSSYAGQDSNQPSILALGRATLRSVWTELVEDFSQHHATEQRTAQMNSELEQMETLVAAMRRQFEEAK